MLVVGLTGGIATGKSTVSSLLKSHSVPVVDADVIAREVVLPGTPAHSKIVSYFGTDVLLPDGNLDRPRLGAVIFNDEQKRRKLNSIVHPAVRRAMIWQVVKKWFKGDRYCIMDIPLLIETGLYKWVGKVVVVSCPEDLQLHRLMTRDRSTREAAMSRIKSQMPISVKTRYADTVVSNAGALEELDSQVKDLVLNLERETRWTWAAEWIIPPLGLLTAALTVLVRTARRSVSEGLNVHSVKNE